MRGGPGSHVNLLPHPTPSEIPGLVAQWESVRLTRGRSLVRTQPGPPQKALAMPGASTAGMSGSRTPPSARRAIDCPRRHVQSSPTSTTAPRSCCKWRHSSGRDVHVGLLTCRPSGADVLPGPVRAPARRAARSHPDPLLERESLACRPPPDSEVRAGRPRSASRSQRRRGPQQEAPPATRSSGVRAHEGCRQLS